MCGLKFAINKLFVSSSDVVANLVITFRSSEGWRFQSCTVRVIVLHALKCVGLEKTCWRRQE